MADPITPHISGTTRPALGFKHSHALRLRAVPRGLARLQPRLGHPMPDGQPQRLLGWLCSLAHLTFFPCVSSHFGGSHRSLEHSRRRSAHRRSGVGSHIRTPTRCSARICASFASSALPPVASPAPARGDRRARARGVRVRARRLRRLRRLLLERDRGEDAHRDPRGRYGRGQQRELRARLGLNRQRRLADHARPRTRRRQRRSRADLRGRLAPST